MKYSDSNPPLVCMMTNSTCYKGTGTMQIKGVLWHSTGANNPWLKRYVQPSNDDPNYDKLIKLLGKNQYNNDFNHIYRQAGLNCWIGKLADGTVTTIQTMPWNYRPWGCGSGKKGSCNTGWIQFEICESDLKDETYFNEVYKEACEITAYLCKKFNIDPNGTAGLNGVTVPTILCHQDSYQLGLGSNHGDVYHWFKKYNKDMTNVRQDVAAILGGKESAETPSTPPMTPDSSIFKPGDKVALTADATYYNGKQIPDWVKAEQWIVKSVSGDRVVINESVNGKYTIMSAVNIKHLRAADSASVEPAFAPYTIRVNTAALNVRSEPSMNGIIKAVIRRGEVYTIVNEDGDWGKLKSGIGWINLKYTIKINS